MAKLKKIHFYYGAILDALCQYNPDASPVLMSKGEESRQVYRVMTNTSKECILFFKHASPKTGVVNLEATSYLFSFTDEDKERLKLLSENCQLPILIYLLCKNPNLKDSEIIVLKYEEYLNVEENSSITIRIEKGKNSVLLFKKGNKSRDNAYQIQRNRIEKTFSELADETMKEGHPEQNLLDSLDVVKKEKFSDSMICPVCEKELSVSMVHNGKEKLYTRYCFNCKRRFVNTHIYKVIRKYCGDSLPMPELYLMDYPIAEEKPEKSINYTNESKEIMNQVNDKDCFYVMEDESEICPIHNCKMEIRTISFGIKKKDTIHYCKKCNKKIVSRKQKVYLENMATNQRNRLFQKLLFRTLK